MKVEKTQSGLYVPSEPPKVKKREYIKWPNGLRVIPHKEFCDRVGGTPIEDRYVLIDIHYSDWGVSPVCGGYCVYPGEGKPWYHFNACILTKDRAEELLEHYKKQGFESYT